MAEVIPSRLAADELARALCGPRSNEDAMHGRLRVLASTPTVVRALIDLLDDVRVEEWFGESGVRYREYAGPLPCGLTLVVQTDAALVPPVQLDGGAS